MRIILCGPAASGKDFLKRRFEYKGFKTSISYTTREPRANEKDGVDYLFVSDEEFMKLVEEDAFLEWQEFPTKVNGIDIVPKYGTTKKHFEEANLFIMTPAGIRDLSKDQRDASMIIYLNVDESIRANRMLERINGDDVETRLKNDRKDFENFCDYDMLVTNADF